MVRCHRNCDEDTVLKMAVILLSSTDCSCCSKCRPTACAVDTPMLQMLHSVKDNLCGLHGAPQVKRRIY